MTKNYDTSWDLIESNKGFLPIDEDAFEKIYLEWKTRNWPLWLLAMLLVLTGFPTITVTEDEKPWSSELHVKRYFGSHTSFEFDNFFPPYQSPLSRLEFPLNNGWAGGGFRRQFSRISAGVEVLRNISSESSDSHSLL